MPRIAGNHRTSIYVFLRTLAVCSLLAIIMAGSVRAQTTEHTYTYTYTGPALTSADTYSSTTPFSTCPPICNLTGSFTFAQPLPLNAGAYGTLEPFNPVSFTITDGLTTITNLNGFISFSMFIQDGYETEWQISVSRSTSGLVVGGVPISEVNFFSQSFSVYHQDDYDCASYYPFQQSQQSEVVCNPFGALGTWSGPSSSAPPPPLVLNPVAAAFTPTAGSPFTSSPFVASGGTPPYEWSVSNLPGELSLVSGSNQATIQGTATAPSEDMSLDVDGELFTYSGATYSITVTDHAGGTANATFSMTALFNPFVPLPKPAKDAALQAGLTKSVEGLGIALAVVACESIPLCAPAGAVEAPEISGFEVALMESAAGDYLQALDPPDPNYTVIATPQEISVPIVQSYGEISATLATALNNLNANESSQVSLKLALVSSLNRASGAEIAQNTIWQMNQLQAAKWYSLQLAALVASEGALRQSVTTALAGTSLDIAFDPTSIDQAIREGSTSAQTFLEAAGLTQDQLSFVQNLLANSKSTFTSVDLAGAFVDAATMTALVQEANSYAAFGTDRNNDGVVSCADLLVVKQAFGAVRGKASYSPMADVNDDGVVNILDLSLVAKQLPAGTVCQ